MEFNGAICLTLDSEACEVITHLMQTRGLHQFCHVTNQDSAIDQLKADPGKILVVDWGVGPKNCARVLFEHGQSEEIVTRPVLVFSKTELPALPGVAKELEVTSLHMGTIDESSMMEAFNALFAKPESELEKRLHDVREARSAGNWEEAGNILNELENDFPDDPRVLIDIVENHLYFNEADQAIMYLNPLVGEKDADVRVINSYARALMKCGRFEEAANAMERAQAINPHNIDRLIQMGEAFLNLDWNNKAVEKFDAALELDENNLDAMVGKGRALAQDGDLKKALLAIRESGSPREMSSMFNSAAIMAIRNGRFLEGMHLYKLAAKAGVDDQALLSRIAFNMGLGFHRWGDGQQSYYYFSLSAHLDPSYEKATHNASAIRKAVSGCSEYDFSGDNQLTYFIEVQQPKPGQAVPDDVLTDEYEMELVNF